MSYSKNVSWDSENVATVPDAWQGGAGGGPQCSQQCPNLGLPEGGFWGSGLGLAKGKGVLKPLGAWEHDLLPMRLRWPLSAVCASSGTAGKSRGVEASRIQISCCYGV